MALRLRTVRSPQEMAEAVWPISHYFGRVPTEEEATRFGRTLPLERMHAVFDGGRIVAGSGVFPFELTVPGGPLPCAGVTVVGVLPSHRRRGLLRRMMTVQLADIRERGEPIAALWASEDTVYGRYGYGAASNTLNTRLPRVSAELRPDLPPREGEVRLVDYEEAVRVFPRIYERVRRGTTGFISRSPAWWEERILSDRPERRWGGAGVLNHALLELDGRPAGYALYRIVPHPTEFKRSLRVIEAIAAEPRALRELWRFLLAVDWMDEIEGRILPLDHPLRHLVASPRLLGMRVEDGLWLRLVDVGAALSARSYAGDGRVTLEVVSDPVFADNVGCWTIEGGDARRTRRRPDVRLDVQALGSVFLGGFSFAELARAELVDEAARGGLARADALFRTESAPWCPEIF